MEPGLTDQEESYIESKLIKIDPNYTEICAVYNNCGNKWRARRANYFNDIYVVMRTNDLSVMTPEHAANLLKAFGEPLLIGEGLVAVLISHGVNL